MSAEVALRNGPTAAASGDTTLLTVADGHKYKLTKFHIVNTSTSASVDVKIGISSSSDGSLITPLITIPKKQMVDREIDVTLMETETLVANCSTATATVTTSYIDVYPHL